MTNSTTKKASKETIFHPTWIEIDSHQFALNILKLKNLLQNSLICLPVKANGYGHGIEIMGELAEKNGVDYLAVSCLQEGISLRKASIQLPIIVLGAIHEDQIKDLLEYDLEFSISSKFKADLVKKQAKGTYKVHLEVDTGMQRTGVRPSTAIDLYKHVKSLGCFEIKGIYSHFASSKSSNDPIAIEQLKSFLHLIKNPILQDKNILFHMANSGGVLHFKKSHLDLVRPGILSYGYMKCDSIAPFFSLKSRVSYFKVVEAGMGISYGHTYKTKKRTRIVTIPIGYGDGYRRSLSNRADVLIRGKKYKIAGAICMDQFMVDVGDDEVYVGDEVVLIGKQGNVEIPLKEIASLTNTIPYEILCSFNQRIPRIVV